MSQVSSSSVFADGQDQTLQGDLLLLRKQSLQSLANGSLILATILFFINLYVAIQQQNLLSCILILLLYLLTFLATFMQSFSIPLRISMLAGAFWGTGVLSLLSQGLNANGILYFFTFVLLLAVLFDKNEWFWGLVVSAVTLTVCAILIGSGILRQNEGIVNSSSPLFWVSIVILMVFIAYLIASTIARIMQNLRKTIFNVRSENKTIMQKDLELTSKINSLETDLGRRRSRLIAARQIAREISQTSDLNTLLKESVELISTQFGYSHAGIFLKDSRAEFAVLKAATGEAGKTMLARKHQLKIREEGIVGYVIAKGEVRIASDVGEDSVHFKNPLLPATKSEMAIPMRTGNEIIGALDIQSDKVNAFSIEDVEIIQTIADELAVAIDRGQQIQQLKQSNTELQEGYRAFTTSAWKTHIKGSNKKLNFIYNRDHLQEASQPVPFFKETLSSGRPVISKLEKEQDENAKGVILSVPIKLREQILGVVNLKYDGNKLPNDLVNLMNTASDRLAIALENARLLEQIQERAETEHAVSDISNKVRSSADIDTILRTTAVELSKSLGIDEVRIQLKTSGNEN